MKTIKYYGFATHFILGNKCAYHIATNIGNEILVSTVGSLRNPNLERVNQSSYYETMVFKIDGEDEHGNPNILDLTPICEKRTDDSKEAELIHFNIVQSYINGDSIKLVH